MRTRVKICGITRPEDAIVAARSGADAIGLVFYEKSPRYIDQDTARLIIDSLPAYVTIVGLFVNHSGDQVKSIAQNLGLDLLQFHGDETPAECEATGLAYMKAVRVKDEKTVNDAIAQYSSARSLLVDSYDKNRFGGTGESFNWDLLPKSSEMPLVLAGGLNPGNVTQAVEAVQPWAVDVSSGVESAPGIKSESLIKKFIEGVNNVDARRRDEK